MIRPRFFFVLLVGLVFFVDISSWTTTSVFVVALSSPSPSVIQPSSRNFNNNKGTVIVAGATGYIGKSVVRESIRQGYNTIALVRDLNKVQNTQQGQQLYGEYFQQAQIIECNVSDQQQLQQVNSMCFFLTRFVCQ